MQIISNVVLAVLVILIMSAIKRIMKRLLLNK